MSSRKELYHNYIKELGKYNPDFLFKTSDEIADNFRKINDWYDLSWFDIYDGIECVGFIIVTNGDHCPVEYDYYISEVYIDPAHRGKGLMTRTLERLVKTNLGIWGLYIIANNEPAIKFWNDFYKIAKIKTIPPRVNKSWQYGCIEESFKTS